MVNRLERVLVINTNRDTAEILRVALEQAQFATLSSVRDRDIKEIVEVEGLRCVVYDVMPPWEDQWAFFDEVRSTAELNRIPFILTSIDPKRVAEWCSAAAVNNWRLVGKPYDLAEITAAVATAVKTNADSP